MARRNALQRLTWCSREQLELIAKNIAFDVSTLPADADPAMRAKLLYEWSTSIRGPGLLSLEAAIPWSVEPEMARQFEVQSSGGADEPRSTASFSSQAPVTITTARPIAMTSGSAATNSPATPSIVATDPLSGGGMRKPTIWEGSTFSASYDPPRSTEAQPVPEESTSLAASADFMAPYAGNETREPTAAPKPSPDDATPRISRPETPHGVPAYGERAEADLKAQLEARQSNDPDPSETEKTSSNKWWRNLLGKGGK